MIIKLNGKDEKFEKKLTISELINIKKLDKNGVVVLLNDKVIKRDRFDEFIIKDKDRVEILRFVAGG